MRFGLAYLLLCSATPLFVFGQTTSTTDKHANEIFLRQAKGKIRIDGVLNEEDWFCGEAARNFWEYFPNDSVRADLKTEIFMCYDERNLYVAARCYSDDDQYIVPSLRRDYSAGGSDNLTFIFDPFNDRTNAFVFGMNPLGVMREALIFNGGQNGGRDWDSSWDNRWTGVSKIHDGYWACEIAIPLSTLRFKEGNRVWNFNSYRFDTQSNTRTIWQRIPQNQSVTNLAFLGKMRWEEAPPTQKSSVTLIPYTSGRLSNNYEENTGNQSDLGFGGDIKIPVSPSLNLDLTFNPDFSQVEVDQQVINLDRFEVFFPERRQFFLENADLFGGFGERSINPFFSRRIGISNDTTGATVQTPLVYGARLSGKLDQNWRVGLLNAQTLKDVDRGLPNVNYTVAAVQRKVFSRSNIGMIFVNREAFTEDPEIEVEDKYNRVIGLDYNIASNDDRWNGKVYYHQAFTTDEEFADNEKFAHGAELQYQVRKYSVSWQHSWVRPGYDPRVGFVRRNNYFRINPQAQIFFYPKQGPINRHSIGVDAEQLWTPGTGKTDDSYSVFWDVNLNNTGGAFLSINNNFIQLLEPFDPTRTEDAEELPLGGYRYTDISMSYRSDSRRKLAYRIQPRFGQFFNGNRYGLEASLTYRYQPLGFIEFNANYSRIELPSPYASTSLFLIGPRIDLTFSKSVFLTTFIQYNSQIENINLNSRLQWRFAPVSDFFLVYTDNYQSTDLSVKSRAIVAKVTYWLNL